MTMPSQPDARLDLAFERIVDVPKELIWAAWTTPSYLTQWFTPAPWVTVDCEIDLRPGGMFRTVMRSPEGSEFPNVGCYLEIVPNTRLVWTNALSPGFRPSSEHGDHPFFFFTAMIELETHEQGTRYSARVLHKSEEDALSHAKMGFHEGWGKALDQLVDVVKKLG